MVTSFNVSLIYISSSRLASTVGKFPSLGRWKQCLPSPYKVPTINKLKYNSTRVQGVYLQSMGEGFTGAWEPKAATLKSSSSLDVGFPIAR